MSIKITSLAKYFTGAEGMMKWKTGFTHQAYTCEPLNESLVDILNKVLLPIHPSHGFMVRVLER